MSIICLFFNYCTTINFGKYITINLILKINLQFWCTKKCSRNTKNATCNDIIFFAGFANFEKSGLDGFQGLVMGVGELVPGRTHLELFRCYMLRKILWLR